MKKKTVVPAILKQAKPKKSKMKVHPKENGDKQKAEQVPTNDSWTTEFKNQQEQCKACSHSTPMDDLLLEQTKTLNAYLDAKGEVETYRIFLQNELLKK